jgi:hypothetical protein
MLERIVTKLQLWHCGRREGPVERNHLGGKHGGSKHNALPKKAQG